MVSLHSNVIFCLCGTLLFSSICSLSIPMITAQNIGNPNSIMFLSSNILPIKGNYSNLDNPSLSPLDAKLIKDYIIIIPQGAQTTESGKYFTPLNVIIQSNSKITWKNEDGEIHTATADDGSFDTEIIPRGSSISVTVKGQGIVSYHCTIHPWMKAKLTIS